MPTEKGTKGKKDKRNVPEKNVTKKHNHVFKRNHNEIDFFSISNLVGISFI
jgi:hypothetical protein